MCLSFFILGGSCCKNRYYPTGTTLLIQHTLLLHVLSISSLSTVKCMPVERAPRQRVCGIKDDVALDMERGSIHGHNCLIASFPYYLVFCVTSLAVANFPHGAWIIRYLCASSPHNGRHTI